ncbi:DUF2905 family protein [Virgibacillus halodenitrificans]|uniref:DUF2905 domain-containing protein n=1 Tax=Virgibacillus halodenitrificans TaxID=1482 RepID=A0AAC9IYC4_VIRHA|nr:DUF2905 family protein [Virgibacillus halodenitrificans]APC48151.1 hypothetical protein BME96_08170 [Virgibacillus halodenitrificans]MBD1223786.1 DUF2905 domain-containing protein [Virgibacillus halodenitrificans]MCG1027923.1 DUF2905 domain-containing protein [Virgibacillus halodenitrificans]MCJ0930747.1 DUF2905 domain-containing protein [Virgibacillus halodenitrificans]MEC2159979.1 DUF2905 family protein [Virgibacillus halodenitrificans]
MINNFGKIFLLLGVVFLIIGFIWTFIGKLPGDISFRKGNMTFHFPIMTSIIISIIITAILFLIGKFR